MRRFLPSTSGEDEEDEEEEEEEDEELEDSLLFDRFFAASWCSGAPSSPASLPYSAPVMFLGGSGITGFSFSSSLLGLSST